MPMPGIQEHPSGKSTSHSNIMAFPKAWYAASEAKRENVTMSYQVESNVPKLPQKKDVQKSLQNQTT